MPELSISSDGLSRSGTYRHPGGAPEDAIVWLHGGNGSSAEFLTRIRPRTNVIDVCPAALLLGGDTGWAKPYKAEIPVGAPDNLVDVRFVAAVGAWVRTTWPNVQRVWLAGFSSGGGLVSCCWGSHAVVPYTFDGCAMIGTQIHLPNLGWNWDTGRPPPTAVLYGNGTLDSEDVKKHYNRTDSFSKFKSINGHTSSVDVAAAKPTCCGENKIVSIKDGVGGTKPTRRVIIANLGHSWQACADCHTDDFVVDLFTSAGLKTSTPPVKYPG